MRTLTWSQVRKVLDYEGIRWVHSSRQDVDFMQSTSSGQKLTHLIAQP